MLNWLRKLPRSSDRRKISRESCRRLSLGPSAARALVFQMERLEDRSLLAADLTLAMSVNPPPSQEVVPSEQLVYTIQAANGSTGTTAATGVVVTDNLSGLESYSTSSVSPSGPAVSANGSTVSINLGTLAVNQTYTITIVAFVNAGASGSIQNVASMTNTSNDTEPANVIVTNSTSNATAGATQDAAFLAGTPGDGTTTTGINNLYQELLGRRADAANLSAWVAYGNAHQNAAGDRTIVTDFMNSPEYKAHYVTSLYEVFLGRAPDAGGLNFWTNKMGAPGTPGGHGGSSDDKYVLSGIVGSDEFYQHAGGTPQGWVNALYEDLLGRAADASGSTSWQQDLAHRGGDRSGLVRDLLTSPEAVHDLLDAYYPSVGGTSAAPLPTPGSQAGANSSKLAEITGGGWENLYLQGPYGNSPQANDVFYRDLVGGAAWDDVQYQILTSQQYFANPNRPVNSATGG
ncbi:MAG TPA: DUF4214 domain-containing protein [Pirellulales bacterium]|nr:DUF4214 domain-containing protein [Pirellulales bacterium]